jgi:hypothetical protein
MRFHYNLYPAALEKLKASGIEERVQTLKATEDGLPYFGGFVTHGDIISSVRHLKEEGFYKHFPEEFRTTFSEVITGMVNRPEAYSWTVKKPGGNVSEPCDLADLQLFTGQVVSTLLTPEEIWDYSKFGFSSPQELVTVAGIYLMQQSSCLGSFKEGLKWTTQRADGSEMVTEINGSSDYDLRVHQTDIAPYPVIDPFGNAIELRPELNEDRNLIATHHSTEATMFVAVMRYIEQQGIETDYLKESAKQLIEWGSSFGQRGGACTEHLFDDSNDHETMMAFIGYEREIPTLNEENETDQHSQYWLRMGANSAYGAYVGSNGDLVFSRQDDADAMRQHHKPITMRFLPSDAEPLLKGLVYQCAKGLGRTSAKKLFGMLEYRYSPQFEKDQARWER